MLVLQAVPVRDVNAYKLLRARIRLASTWVWANKARTRLRHIQRQKGGHIDIADAHGVLVAKVQPKTPSDLFYLAEKFTGRLIAWFEHDLHAIDIQFIPGAPARKPKARPRKRKRARRKK